MGYLPHTTHVLDYFNQSHQSLSPRGDLRSIPGVSLPQLFFKMFHAEVGVSVFLIGVQAMKRCLCLQWGRIINLYHIHVHCQGYVRWVKFLPLVQVLEIPVTFSI